MNAGSLQALCQLGKLASRPRNSIAIVGCRASHCVIANARASATCQSVGISCIITEALPGNHRTERTGGVAISLYANNITNIIILVNKGFVKSLVVSETTLRP